MAETSIEWTRGANGEPGFSFNPWIGCSKVSPGCDHCYAESWAKRYGTVEWGTGKPRKLTSDANWKQPLKWNKEAAAAGVRARVFCASLADAFDNEVPDEWRARLWELIRTTPNLDWLLLTKRVGNISKMLPADWSDGWPNVWMGASIVNQEEADRDIPKLLLVPARVRFLSMEPLLGNVNLRLDSDRWVYCNIPEYGGPGTELVPTINGLHWIIAGGESGKDARPMHPAWAQSLRDQCQAAGIPFLFKQWGSWRPVADHEIPQHFGSDCDDFRCMCSNGFLGELSIGSAFLHKPDRWPQCFPSGADGDASCQSVNMRNVSKKAAGRLLDGREYNQFPNLSVPPQSMSA